MNRHFLTAAAIAATATACFLPERHSDVSWDRPPLSTASAPTYHKDVESIFQRQCQNCHRPGAIAPFSMLTYDDARKHAREIRSSVADGSMPPWKLEAGCGEFRDTRGLTKEEIATVTSWVDANT
ncbi:MAG: c-type cytochrome, partial [Bdellovibrionota bacterium]